MSILDKIIEHTKMELRQKMLRIPLRKLKNEIKAHKTSFPSFLNAMQKKGISIIAEVKKASPSKGLICQDFDPVKIALEYKQGGAAAVSVLTDAKYFQGDLAYLDEVAEQVNLPLLRKDFIIDEYQIYEARAHHASAILLLAGVLEVGQLIDFTALAKGLGLDVLLEVHNLDELDKGLKTPANIIGVNNRDLNSFHVDLSTSEELATYIPSDKIKISESGIYTFADIHRLQQAGYDAFLVGESLMRRPDRIHALQKLRGADVY